MYLPQSKLKMLSKIKQKKDNVLERHCVTSSWGCSHALLSRSVRRYGTSFSHNLFTSVRASVPLRIPVTLLVQLVLGNQ